MGETRPGAVEDETSLGSAEDKQLGTPATLLETSIDTSDPDDPHYKFMEDGVTYRMVELGDPLSGGALAAGQEVIEGATSPGPVQTIYTANALNGGIYVITPPPDVYHPVRPAVKTEVKPVATRDDKRRATHNEVERRRRDKINSWIVKLGKIIPDCKPESSKGSYESQSKGGILAKACDYICELRERNERLVLFVKENEQLLSDVQSLGRQLDDLRRENELLRETLVKHGISPPV